MRDLLRLLPVRNLRRRPLRSLLTVLGATSGVALFVAIEIINASTLGYFADGVRAMAGGAALTASAGEAGFPSAERDRLLMVPGVREAVPTVETVGLVLRADSLLSQAPDPLGVIGVDPRLESLVRSHRIEQAPPGAAGLQALDRADTVLLPAGFAADHEIVVGDSIEMATADGIVRLDVVGTLAAGASVAGVAVMGLPTAQRLFGFEGRLTRLDIVAQDGQDVDGLAASLRQRLGPGFTVENSRAREAGLARIVHGYQALLRFLGAVAALAGTLVLGATIGVSVREQTPSIGILRALGASRARVVSLVVAEATLLGAIAAVLGVLAGRLGAVLLVGAVTRTMAHQYMMPIQVAALHYPFAQAVGHVLLALLAAVVAALVPALRAARLAPVQAVRPTDVQTDPAVPRWLGGLGLIGAALAAYLAIVVAARLDRDVPSWQTANAGIGLFAALLLVPLFARAGQRLVQGTGAGQRLMDRGVVLRLAVGNLLRAPVRSAWNALLLSIGLLMFVTAATLHQSLLASVEGWLDRTASSDLLVSSPGRLFMMEVQPLQEAVALDIDTVPGVRVEQGHGAVGIRYATVRYAGRDITLKAFDPPHPSLRQLPFDLRSDFPLRDGGNIFGYGRPAALVSENFVRHFGLQTGANLALQSPTGPLVLEVIGVVTDYASPEGVVYLPRSLYRRYWQDTLVNVFSVMVEPGEKPATVAAAIDRALGETRGLQTTDNHALRRQMRETLEESFAYTHAMEAAALIAAILGIMNSMMASVLARRREMAVLRAMGMSRLGVCGLVVCESLLQAIPAALAAALLGSLLAYLCLRGVLSALMGWTLGFHTAPGLLAGTLVLGVIAGGIASALAAWTSASVKVSEALVAD
jgi:putative ABC transport system permease protein